MKFYPIAVPSYKLSYVRAYGPSYTGVASFNRKKAAKPKESEEDATQAPEDEYSTVTECAGILTSDPGEPASSGPPTGSLEMVECELYSLSTDAPEDAAAAAMPDISPYACFYGAGKSPVLKAGWLDKLSPQG